MTVDEYIKSKEKFRLMLFITIYTAIKVWKLIDELVEAVKILHPRMYTTFIDKVQDL